MRSFTLTLPSNSSRDYFPTNTTSKFRTKLREAINLEGEWEAGLYAINFPHDWYSIATEQAIRVESRPPIPILPPYLKYIKIKPTYFSTAPRMIEDISKLVEEEYAKGTELRGRTQQIPRSGWLALEYDQSTRRTKVTVPPYCEVAFSPQIADLLGAEINVHLNNTENKMKEILLPRPCDVHRSYHSMYVYCDVLEHVVVGDTCAPLLTICDAQGQMGETVHRRYDRPEYKPVQKNKFDTIEININNNIGEAMPFQSGPSVVTLHFRPAKNYYFN